MPRSGRLRNFIREYGESPKAERFSFIPPFLILFIEIVLIYHALTLNEVFVIILTSILLTVSIIEIIFVSSEIHEHYMRRNFDKILTIRLDDFISERKEKNIKKLVRGFIELHPEHESHRNEIYHTTCQILETHKDEATEKELSDKLKKFIKKREKANVNEIIEAFIEKYPKYKKYRNEIYEIVCQIKADDALNDRNSIVR